MNKQKFYVVIIIALLISNLVLIGFILTKKGPRHAKGPKKDKPKNIVIERLQLDDAQIAMYNELIKVHRTQIKDLDSRIFSIKNNLYSQLNSDNSTVADSLTVEIALAQKEIEVLHYNHFIDIKKLCKEEQLKNYEALTTEISRIFAPPKKKRK